MRSPWQRLAFAATALVAALSCGKGGETREWSTGSALDNHRETTTTVPLGGVTAGGTTAGTSNTLETGTPITLPAGEAVGGAAGTATNTATPSPLSKTLEQCDALGKSWVAVVNSGTSPSVCGDDLSNWCCTEDEIYARFPGMAGAVKQRLDENKAAKYSLYHCSVDAKGVHTFHMAQIGDNFILYKTIFVEGVIESDTGNNAGRAACAFKPTTAMLHVTGAAPTGATLQLDGG